VTRDRALVVQDLAYAALDALRATEALDLCAYLHTREGDGPQLYLRAPDLASMTAAHAFDVFTALRDAVDHAEPDVATRCRIGRFDAVAVRSVGERSSGVFFVGREGEALADDRLGTVEAVCRALGQAGQLVEEAAPEGRPVAPAPIVRVDVAVGDGAVEAAVVLLVDGAEREGRGRAPVTLEAVALATLDAAAPDVKLGGVADADVAGERVVAVLLRDTEDRSALGSALVEGDPVRATAAATLDALAHR
jgi:hypothetical protein